MSGVCPIAVLALIRSTDGGPIVDLQPVNDGQIPTPLSPQSSNCGLDTGDNVVVPLDRSHSNRLVESTAWLTAAIAVVHLLTAASSANSCGVPERD